MIAINGLNEVTRMMFAIGITRELAVRAVNVRHCDIVSHAVDRLICLHWVDESAAILIDAIVTKKKWVENRVTIIEVQPWLGIWLAPQLPGGRFSRDSDLRDVIRIVAASFGNRVSMDPDCVPQFLYDGPSDGKLRIQNAPAKPPKKGCFASFSRRVDGHSELAWSLNYDRYLEWFARSMRASVKKRRVIRSAKDLFNAQQRLLEALFPQGWFTSKKQTDHPARLAWRLCQELAQSNGRMEPQPEPSRAYLMLFTTLTGARFAHATRGSGDEFKLGGLEAYGDAAVIRRLRSEIQTPNGFAAVLLEIYCAAWHIERGHDVVPTQDLGMPDMEIKVPSWERTVYAECKRIVRTSGANRFHDVIRKANSQIKKRGDGYYGIVYIDISDRVDPKFQSHELPREVVEAKELVQKALRGPFFNSIGAVVLLWEQLHLLSKGAAGATTLALTNRSELVPHPQPSVPLPVDSSPLLVGSTVVISLEPTSKIQASAP